MQLSILSWNGDTRINDGTNFTATFVTGSLVNLATQAVYIDRPEQFPYLGGNVLSAHSITLRILTATNAVIPTQRELLKQIFNVTDFTPHALIAQDTLNGNKQWQLIGFVTRVTIDPQVTVDATFLVTLALAEPVWQAVTPGTNTWNVTATGQQQTVNTPGNILTRPTFAITPTSPRFQQYQYARYVPVINRVANGLNNYPIEVTNGGLNTSALVNFTGVSNQLNGAINASVTTIPVNTPVGGGLPAQGMGLVDSEQISWTGTSAGSLTGVTRGIGGTTAASHLNAAVVALSKVQANGADLVVQYDGSILPTYLDSMNTTSTKVWISGAWQPAPILPAVQANIALTVALPNNGSNCTIQLPVNNVYAKTYLTYLKSVRNTVLQIDSEFFTFSAANIDLINYKITGVVRAQKNSAFAAHNVGAVVFWIEHDIWLLYGNQTSVLAPVITATQPLLDLHNSTNTSWVQTQFYDNTANRPAAWVSAVSATAGKQSYIFTGNQEAFANPATEMGAAMLDYQVANVWKGETATMVWGIFHPAGVTTTSIAGKKFVNPGTSFPAAAGLRVTNDNVSIVTIWNETAPVVNTWTAFTHNGVALGATYNYLYLYFTGSLSALANQQAAIQFDTVTLTLNSSNTPSVTLNAENSQYYLNCVITNTTTGDYITVAITMFTNHTLTINTALKTVTYDDGSNQIAALTPSTVRNDWLPLIPGNNVLQFDDVGTNAITVVTTWNDRTI